MNAKAAVVLLSGVLFACAPVPTPAPPPPPPAPVPAPETDTRQHHIVTIRAVTCSGLLAASEEDRAAAEMFYIGYTASRRGQRKIDVAEVDGLNAEALGYCEAFPEKTAAFAYNKAFADNGR
jgi:hypothetical protein